MNEWIETELKHLTTKIGSGATPRGGQEAYKSEGISLIRSQNILDFSFSNNGLAFIDDDQARQLQNVEIKEKDVLINITGDSVARVCMVPIKILPARVNQHVAILRTDSNQLDPDYLLYYLLNPIIKRHLLRISSDGATRNALTKSNLEELRITAPKNLDEQKEIAAKLKLIDSKITLLRQQNETMEELAQTLFKRWFVDFEFPNEKGEPYKSSGGKMIDSELGEIPEGWSLTDVGEFVKHSTESINPNNFQEKEFYHFSIPAFDNGRIPVFEKGSQILSNKYLVKNKSILISKLNPSTSRIWPIINAENNYISSTEIQVFIPRQNYFSFVFGLLHSRPIKKEMVQRASGTSSSHQRVRPYDILNLECINPQKLLVEQFEKTTFNLLSKVEINITSLKKMVDLRDSLLPKLMSGELTIKNN